MGSATDGAQGSFFDLSKPAGLKRLREHLRRHEHAEVNQYFTANVTAERITGKSGVASEEDIAAIRALVIDLDPEKEGVVPLAEERDRIREQAQAAFDAEVPPTMLIDTGGGAQLLWLLEEPVPVTPESAVPAVGLMKSLTRLYGGDTATCTLKNLFRLPGTRNLPTPTKKAKGRGVTYAGLPFSGGPKTTLERLAAFAPSEEVEGEREADPAEDVGTDCHELIDVLARTGQSCRRR